MEIGADYRCRNSILDVVEESRQTSWPRLSVSTFLRRDQRLDFPSQHRLSGQCALPVGNQAPVFFILVILVSAVRMFPLDRHQHLNRHSSHWIRGESKGIDQAWLPNASCSRAQRGSTWLSFQCPATLYPTECNSWGRRPTRCVHSSLYFADEL